MYTPQNRKVTDDLFGLSTTLDVTTPPSLLPDQNFLGAPGDWNYPSDLTLIPFGESPPNSLIDSNNCASLLPCLTELENVKTEIEIDTPEGSPSPEVSTPITINTKMSNYTWHSTRSFTSTESQVVVVPSDARKRKTSFHYVQFQGYNKKSAKKSREMTPLSSLLTDFNTDSSKLNLNTSAKKISFTSKGNFDYPYHLINGSHRKRKSKNYDDSKKGAGSSSSASSTSSSSSRSAMKGSSPNRDTYQSQRFNPYDIIKTKQPTTPCSSPTSPSHNSNSEVNSPTTIPCQLISTQPIQIDVQNESQQYTISFPVSNYPGYPCTTWT
ncbi:DgyrCDS2527 [Dimorphilus gyrociliatus]|uniref:DgyrCDS2527 n=1 Tax=Dimorphilus gyrociliatus TaxID=2664684 RepID=A0A7I8VAY9_9ANNE|nr:DgyrCDS2527 [Dimorphilus gyrociliatus]